jgi:4-amino-4-deoxy-L-arabinose transferase-like glycosyltransferase
MNGPGFYRGQPVKEEMRMQPEQGNRFDLVLAGIVLLAAFLNIFNIWNQASGNVYYTTAVTSMLQSWHNFFYGSLDPGGYVTVDKPPVTFWVQTGFAYVFGVHGWSVILPQALAGVGSVILMYILVKPSFGRTAARLAALVMACTPVAVAVSRTNNIDSMLVFTLLLGTWMLFKGIRGQKTWWIIGAFAMIGVGFNMKMLQAYMVVPAFYLLYLLAFKGEWKKKLVVLLAATVVLLGVTLSWAVAVDLVSEKNRPYIGGSDTNSVLELAFGYNGIARLKGMGRGGGGAPGGAPGRQVQQDAGTRAERQQNATDATGGVNSQQQSTTNSYSYNTNPRQTVPDSTSNEAYPPQAPFDTANASGQAPPDAANMADQLQMPPDAAANTTNPQQAVPGVSDMPDQLQAPPGAGYVTGGDDPRDAGSQAQPPGTGGDGAQGTRRGSGAPQGGRNAGGGMFNTGSAGPLRLFQSALSGQISWLLPFAAFAGVGLLAGNRRRKPLSDKYKETLFWLAWLIPGMVFFSVAGFFHQYYLIMLAPPVAALAGAGGVELWNRYSGRDGWKTWLLPAAVLVTAAFQLYILYPYYKTIGTGWLIALGTAGFGIALALVLAAKRQKLAAFAAAASILVLLAAPLYWSATPLLYGDNSQLPAAGPSQQGPGGGQRQGGNGSGTSSVTGSKLYQYVKSHNTGETYLFASSDTGTAETYIMQTGEAVMPMGGFNGSDQILTVEKLEQMIADKKVKFFLLGSGGGGGAGGGASDVIGWIIANSTEVPKEDWQDTSSSSGTLYEINIEDEM